MKAWSTVNSTGRLNLNWTANSAWDPLLDMPVQCWRFADTLKHIYLNDNNLRVLPQNIAIMHELRELHLERNGLSVLPYVMCQMTNLQVLNLMDNSDMHDPPYEIVVEMKLRGIMKYLRAMHMAPMLKSLVLQDFEVRLRFCDGKFCILFVTTVKCIFCMIKLYLTQVCMWLMRCYKQLFYLKFNDLIQTTVEELSVARKKASFARSDGQPRNPGEVNRINRRLALFDIEALSLDSNVFDSLPDTVLLFTRLSLLSLSSNRLELITDKVEAISSLTVLHLDNNQLGSIPDALASNIHMKKLTLNRNQFLLFPDVILRLTSLEVLNLASNQITELPPELPSCNSNLKMLALQHNAIHSLPADWGLMKKLVLLDMSNNNIIYVPPSLSQCRRLKAFYLSDNPVPAFPKEVLKILGLQQLRFANTLMKGLPPELALLTNLRELALEGNQLVWPPEEVLAEGFGKIMEYVTEHYEILDLDIEDILEHQKEAEQAEKEEEEEEEEFDPFEGMEVGGAITVHSILEHGARIDDFIADMQEFQQELEQLQKEHVKHTRIGNKGKIAELDRSIDFINKQRRTIAGRIVEINNLRNMEQDLLIVDHELDLMDAPPIKQEEEEWEEDEEEDA